MARIPQDIIDRALRKSRGEPLDDLGVPVSQGAGSFQTPSFSPPEVTPVTVSEQGGVLQPGNIDVSRRPHVYNDDGSVSTVNTMGYQDDDGSFVNIPLVSDEGRMMQPDEAIKYNRAKGQHLGRYSSQAQADAAAQRLHEDQQGILPENTLNDVRPRSTVKQAEQDRAVAQKGQLDALDQSARVAVEASSRAQDGFDRSSEEFDKRSGMYETRAQELLKDRESAKAAVKPIEDDIAADIKFLNDNKIEDKRSKAEQTTDAILGPLGDFFNQMAQMFGVAPGTKTSDVIAGKLSRNRQEQIDARSAKLEALGLKRDQIKQINERFTTDASAKDAVTLMRLNASEAALNKIASSSKSLEERTRAEAAVAKIRNDKAALQEGIANQQLTEAQKRAAAGTKKQQLSMSDLETLVNAGQATAEQQTAFAEAKKKLADAGPGEGNGEFAPGYVSTIALGDGESSAARKILADAAEAQTYIATLKGIRSKNGDKASWNKTDIESAGNARNMLAAKLNVLVGQGAMTGEDARRIMNTIPDPTSMAFRGSPIQTYDAVSTQLRNAADAKVSAYGIVRNRQPGTQAQGSSGPNYQPGAVPTGREAQSAQQAASMPVTMVNPTTGQTLRVAPALAQQFESHGFKRQSLTALPEMNADALGGRLRALDAKQQEEDALRDMMVQQPAHR